MNRIVLIIALLVGGQEALAQTDILSAIGKWARTQRQAQSVQAAVEAFLKERANDPSKVKIARISRKRVSTAKAHKWMGGRAYREWKPLGVVRKGFWQPIGRPGVAVAVRYRTTNVLGALVLNDKVFCISRGVVFDWMALDDFRPTRPQRRSDPMTDAFLKLAR